jgi:hypothetical protein
MTKSTSRRPRYTVHDGFRMPMGFPVDAFESGQQYRAQPGDVFVATYPKCGTTWVQYIVYLLLHDAEALAPGQSLGAVFPHLEEVGRDAVAALPLPRLIKTHLPLERTPWHDRAKYVFVARNPFDCAVSFYHHTRGFVRHYDFADGTWDAFFECFLAGEVDFGDYFDHLLSWWPRRAAANVLFLTYEDLMREPAHGIGRIAAFLGGAAAELAAEPARLESVVRQSSFDGMRSDQERWASRRPENMPAFVRKGVVGDWQSTFSPEQARRLAEKLERRAAGTGIERLWPDLTAALQ